MVSWELMIRHYHIQLHPSWYLTWRSFKWHLYSYHVEVPILQLYQILEMFIYGGEILMGNVENLQVAALTL